MYGRVFLAVLLASVIATEVLSHDLIYKPIRRSPYEELPDTIPIFKKIPAFKRSQPLHLPTLKSSTSHGNICSGSESKCLLSTGQEGCCPYENGTCCVDRLTCCPFGYQCNIKDGTCAVKHHTDSNTVVCPDGQSQCPDGSTCCKLKTGQWGCCPLEKATCCSDGIHCCPNGYKCDVSSGTCTKGDIVHALTKTKSNAVVCPDGQSQCPDGSTCCKLQSGQWGCCPLEKATCCSDGIHCCPNGYKCDVSAGTCSKSGSIMQRAKLSSCCTFVSGSILCCKNGLVCNPKTYQCTAPVSEVSQISTTAPVRTADTPVSSGSNHVSMFAAQRRLVACAAGLNCGSKSTCCISDSGSAKCCNHSDGVCCAGGSTCCPRGFHCAANGKCAISAQLP